MSTPDNRSVNSSSLFYRGQHCSRTWPLGKHLVSVFIENHAIKMARYAIYFIPPIAVFILCWQTTLGGQFRSAVATALLVLGLSMRGLWWLGKRSAMPLPPTTLNWFYEARGKLQEFRRVLAPIEGKPDYQALADTLKRTFKQLDKTFPDDLQLTPDYAYKKRHAQPSFFSS